MKDYFFDEIFEEMRSGLKEFFSHPESNVVRPPANIKETQDKWLIEIALPGVKKDDIRIKIDENKIMSVEGESFPEEEEIICFHRLEWSLRKFKVKFQLSDDSDPSQIESILKDGILKITVPKREKKSIEIKIE